MGEYGESVESEAATGAFTASQSNTMQSLAQFRDGFDLLLHRALLFSCSNILLICFFLTYV